MPANTLITVTTERLSSLFDHLAWANRAVIESLKSQTSLPGKAKAILGHLLAAEDLWLWRIRNEPQRSLPVWTDLTLLECETQVAKNSAGYRELLGALDDEGLGKTVVYVNTKGVRYENSVEDILVHVCMHGSYHRGQIASLVRESGGEPVNTDYIAYVRSRTGAARTERDR